MRKAFGSGRMWDKFDKTKPAYFEGDVSAAGLSNEVVQRLLGRGIMVRCVATLSDPRYKGAQAKADICILPDTPAGIFYERLMANDALLDEERDKRWETFYTNAWRDNTEERFAAHYPELFDDQP